MINKINYSPFIAVCITALLLFSCSGGKWQKNVSDHEYNSYYSGENLDRIAFPIGGMGAGMFCMEGTGAISHMSVQNRPEIYNESQLKVLKTEQKYLKDRFPDGRNLVSLIPAMAQPERAMGSHALKMQGF
jgi:hypothetical protein